MGAKEVADPRRPGEDNRPCGTARTSAARTVYRRQTPARAQAPPGPKTALPQATAGPDHPASAIPRRVPRLGIGWLGWRTIRRGFYQWRRTTLTERHNKPRGRRLPPLCLLGGKVR